MREVDPIGMILAIVLVVAIVVVAIAEAVG